METKAVHIWNISATEPPKFNYKDSQPITDQYLHLSWISSLISFLMLLMWKYYFDVHKTPAASTQRKRWNFGMSRFCCSFPFHLAVEFCDGQRLVLKLFRCLSLTVRWLEMILLFAFAGAVWRVLSLQSAPSTCPIRAFSSLDLISWWTRTSKCGSLRSTEPQPVHSQ